MQSNKLFIRKPIRLKNFDYSQNGCYFVTICTCNKQNLFGSIVDAKIQLNDIGHMVNSVLNQISEKYTSALIDQYIVMPNHVHAIIVIENIVGVDPRVDPGQNEIISNNYKINCNGRTQGSAPTKLSLSMIIKRFKTLTTKKYIAGVKHNNWKPFNKYLWQRSFYDHVIRNDQSLNQIRKYIISNPLNWENDEENINNNCRVNNLCQSV